MGQVARNGEFYAFITYMSPYGIFSKTDNLPQCLQHVPIAMITKNCNRKQSCCNVTYCLLIPAWATTIHKFQGFEAGFDENDQFNHLIVDPGDLTTKQQNPGILYVEQ
jgi:hypothetical protein